MHDRTARQPPHMKRFPSCRPKFKTFHFRLPECLDNSINETKTKKPFHYKWNPRATFAGIIRNGLKPKPKVTY